MPNFTYAAVCTNVHAMTAGVGAGIEHSWDTTSAPKLVCWTSCPICNWAMDGRPSTLPAWKIDDVCFDLLMYDVMLYSHWRSIKRFLN